MANILSFPGHRVKKIQQSTSKINGFNFYAHFG